MSINVWGLEPKSQIDPETVEEAITRLIGVHEADPTSHLGENESIDAHRKSEVIDHLAQSIVADKFSVTNAYTTLSLGVIDSDYLDNCLGYGNPLGIDIYQTSSFSGTGIYSISSFLPYDIGYADGDIVWNFEITAPNGSGTWTASVSGGFAKIELKFGYYRVGYYSGGWNYGSWIAIQDLFSRKFRFFYDSIAGSLKVYLGANLVYSHTHAIDFEYGEMAFILNITRGNLSTADLFTGAFSYALAGI